ncbi:hypothetical protein DPMN_050929 [Dreissena polymorpha]|uniref:Uncharacterized protein n=1 Tax=Dreissena polymorpha TaxID=45954 RepID=A0A9D4CI66_DREPO|nr:hypothetical protein DPMN_050929 [Dreissena polymorpha]
MYDNILRHNANNDNIKKAISVEGSMQFSLGKLKQWRLAVRVGRLTGEQVGVGPLAGDESSDRQLLLVAPKGSSAVKSYGFE